MKTIPLFLLSLSLLCGSLPAQDKTPATPAPAKRPAPAPLPDDVEKRSVKIWSDGTRMAAHLYLPKNRKPDDKLPAVVLCAGTGGTKENTGGRLGPILAQHGYIALAFDYRGWGESDSRLMSIEPQPKLNEQHEMTIKVKALRGQMSYAEQTEDIRAAISYIVGEPGVDAARIGLWGTSYGGGLVVWATGNDPRVKCLAAQVPGMGPGNNPAAMKFAYALATKQARGETEPVPVETGKLTGALARYTTMRRNPVKSLGFSAVDAAAKITAPSLFVVAEKEELSGNDVVERVQQDLVKRGVPSVFHVIAGITHYGVYVEGFTEATRVEVEWFDKHLKK
jgi:dienelactone hydrolase